MQIPPNTALVNLLASLPAQGITATPITAAPAAAKGPQPVATPQPAPVTSAADGRPPSGILPRGSIINILA